MKKIFLVAVLCVASSLLLADGPRIVTINTAEIAEKSDEIIKAREAFQRDYKRQTAKIESLEQEIKELQANYQSKAKTASDADIQKMEEQLQRKMSDYRALSDKVQKKLTKKQEELLQPILEKVDKIAKANGYDIVFDVVSGKIVFSSEKYDVTQKMLEELN